MKKNRSQLSCDKIRIDGMTCASCEVILERTLKTMPGIEDVEVNHATGECRLYSTPQTVLQMKDIRKLVEEKGYHAELWDKKTSHSAAQRISVQPSRNKQLKEAGVMLLVLFALYSIFNSLGIFSFSTAIDSSVSYGAIFLIGIVAAFSTCIAVVGGLLLTAAATYAKARPNATGWQKFKPHLLFNVGRLVSYLLLGGLIGVIGKAITPSPRFTGILTVLISFVMILLAVDILQLFQSKRWIPRMPKFISHKIHNIAESDSPWAALTLGALTFFLPCGFTQSMQLYALTTGSFWKGGLTMFVFALGTLPALVGLGAVSSFAKGSFSRIFLTFSGVVVLLLGIYNLNNGLRLTGVDLSNIFGAPSPAAAEGTSVPIVNGKQVVTMSVKGLKYDPARITIKKGIPVEWHVNGSQAAGCASALTVPDLDITEYLSPSKETVITFTPEQVGPLAFMCTMGMARGQFTVIE